MQIRVEKTRTLRTLKHFYFSRKGLEFFLIFFILLLPTPCHYQWNLVKREFRKSCKIEKYTNKIQIHVWFSYMAFRQEQKASRTFENSFIRVRKRKAKDCFDFIRKKKKHNFFELMIFRPEWLIGQHTTLHHHFPKRFWNWTNRFWKKAIECLKTKMCKIWQWTSPLDF